MRLGKKSVFAIDLSLWRGRISKALSNRSPTEVPVKTVFNFGALCTGFRNGGRPDELPVEIGSAAVEKGGKTNLVFN